MNFQRYGSIENSYRDRTIMTYEKFGLTAGQFVCQEKCDGCFSAETTVATESGVMTISKIVNQKLPIRVKSYNETTGEIEYKPVINWYRNGETKNWLKVTFFDAAGRERNFVATPNHKIYNKALKKTALETFKVGDKLVFDKPTLTATQKDLLLGSILGDGSFRNTGGKRSPLYSETHSVKQSEYALLKAHILGNLISKVEYQKQRFSAKYPPTGKVRFYTKSIPNFRELTRAFYVDGEKKVPDNIKHYLNAFSLAIWYCDDGSTSFSTKQRPRARFHTEGFSLEENEILAAAIDEVIGFFGARVYEYRGYYYVQLSADATEELFEAICEFVPECMNYKLPEKYHNRPKSKKIYASDFKNLSEVTIKSIEKITKTSGKYDIEVADNHNYFVKGVLVSNSNFSFWLNKEKTKFRCAKRSGYIGGMGSFYNHDDVESDNKDKIFALLDHVKPKDYVAVYGEIFGGNYPHPDVEQDKFSTSVQNRVWYSPKNLFFAFDLIVDGKFVGVDEANEAFEAAGLLYAKTLFRGTFEECMAFNPNFLTTIPAELGLPPIEDNFAEGTVIKPIKPKFIPSSGGRVILKCKAEKFKEREQKKGGKQKKAKPIIELSETGQVACDTVLEYVTENRLRSVLSKMGPVTNKDFGKILQGLVADVLEDYAKDYDDIKSLDKGDRKRIGKELNQNCAAVIRKNILNIIDGLF